MNKLSAFGFQRIHLSRARIVHINTTSIIHVPCTLRIKAKHRASKKPFPPQWKTDYDRRRGNFDATIVREHWKYSRVRRPEPQIQQRLSGFLFFARRGRLPFDRPASSLFPLFSFADGERKLFPRVRLFPVHGKRKGVGSRVSIYDLSNRSGQKSA